MTLFAITDYRTFIREKINENQKIRGYQARLSKAAGVHGSYISRVLNSHVHLTSDQAANLAEFWRLDAEETDYFLDLVLLERSTSSALKARIGQRLSAIRRSRENLAKRFSGAHALNSENRGVYYSAWYFSAIHMLLTIPEFRTAQKISARLLLHPELVQQVLETLGKMGLAESSNSQWRTLQTDVHIAEQKMWARIHHSHWRQKSALKIQEVDPAAVHYSGVHTMSKADALKLKHEVLRFLEQSRKMIAPSPEERLVFLCCDFYEF